MSTANIMYAFTHFQRRLYCLIHGFVVVVFIFKVAFWTLAFVLSHPSVHKTIVEGISSVFGTAGTKPELNYTVEELSNKYALVTCHGQT